MPEALLFTATLGLCWWAALRVAWRWVGGGWSQVAAAAGLLGALAVLVPPACGLAGLVVLALALALAAPGYMQPTVGEGAEMAGVLDHLHHASLPDVRVVTNWRPNGRLIGAGLDRQVELLPTASSCAYVRERAAAAVLVALRDVSFGPSSLAAPGEACFRGEQPAYRDATWAVYVSGEAPGRRSAGP